MDLVNFNSTYPVDNENFATDKLTRTTREEHSRARKIDGITPTSLGTVSFHSDTVPNLVPVLRAVSVARRGSSLAPKFRPV
jgi:hypothetical protein